MRLLINKILKIEKILREKRYTTLSGTLSFFLVLSLVPTLFLVIYLFAKLNIEINIESIKVNRNIEDLLIELVEKANYSNFSYFILLSSLYSSSTLFLHLIKVGELIYQKKRDKVTLFSRLTAVLWLIVFLFFLVFLVIFHFLIDSYLRKIFKGIIYEIVVFFSYFIILFAICLFLNKFIVPYEHKFKEIKKGCLLTVLLWIIVSNGFVIYVKYFSNFDFLYGTLSFFIILLLYIYLLMQCFVVGIIYNNYFQNNTGKKYKKGK